MLLNRTEDAETRQAQNACTIPSASLLPKAYHNAIMAYKEVSWYFHRFQTGVSRKMAARRAANLNAKRPIGKTGAELAELWSSAIIFAPHLAGCTCAGGFHVPLNPNAVEEDLIDFLRHRYRGEGLKDLADYVDSRAASRATSFNVWLRELDTSSLSAKYRNRLIEDLRTTLESMNGMASELGQGYGRNARGEIICY